MHQDGYKANPRRGRARQSNGWPKMAASCVPEPMPPLPGMAGKKDFTGGTKLRPLRWEIILDYPGGPMSSEGSLRERGGRVRERDLWTDVSVAKSVR